MMMRRNCGCGGLLQAHLRSLLLPRRWRRLAARRLCFSRRSSACAGSPKVWDTTEALARGVLRGDRVSLSKAITLVESLRQDHSEQADLLLDHVVSHAPKAERGAFRVGVCGSPGAGKSSFITKLGVELTRGKGHKLAVITVDPSSAFTGGSLLGDRCRMQDLASQPGAFIRSCPSHGVLGGVARYTNSVVQLCEAAGYGIVFVETVGLGQSEVEVGQTVDMLLLLLSPAGGDDLQASKRGIMEVADAIVVNKADGEYAASAKRTAMDYSMAMKLSRRRIPFWDPPVICCSSLTGVGIEEVWEACERFREVNTVRGELERRRREQGRYWITRELHQQLIARVGSDPEVLAITSKLEGEVAQGHMSPRDAARQIIGKFMDSLY